MANTIKIEIQEHLENRIEIDMQTKSTENGIDLLAANRQHRQSMPIGLLD
jgi:hypothetical protein